MQINSIPNDKQLKLLLSGPFSHYTEFGPDDWRDPNKKNSSLSISSKGFFDHKSRESGSLCELCKQHNVPIAENIIQTHKKDLPQSIWDKSEVLKHSDSKSFQIAKSYFTKHRNIPLESYSDLLRKGLIRVNEYEGELMLVYPSLTPVSAALAINSKPYNVRRIQRIFLNADGTKHNNGKKHLGSNKKEPAAFTIPPLNKAVYTGHVLILEGLEDALSLRSMYPSSWFLVATDKSSLKNVIGFFEKEKFKKCLIIADNDTDVKPEVTGQALAWQLGQSLVEKDIQVKVKMPPEPKEDANSALQSGQLGSWFKNLIDVPKMYRMEISENSAEDYNEDLLEELNKKYAVVPIGNKMLILDIAEHEIRFFTRVDFNLALQNRTAIDDSGTAPKPIPASKWWLEHPERREYKSVDFLPGIGTTPDVFNMWHGFSVQPKGGLENIPLFHELIDEVICSGNEKWALYLWSWLAHMIQYPDEKPGVAVVLRSDAQGVGKSRFAEYVGSLIVRHFSTVTHGRHIHGNFNSHLKDTLLLFGDEAVWGGDKSTESILKQLITEPTMIIEMKGKDVFEVRSFLRLMLATNSEWAAPVSLTDRRYFVLNVSNSRKNDHDFFKKLIYEQTHGGSESLLQALMDFDLSDFEVRSIPETPARLEQKMLSMDILQQWWLEILSNEDFTVGGKILDFDDINRVANSDLLKSFNEYTREHKPNHWNWGARQFHPKFKKLIPFANDKRIGSGPREYEFPSLNECKLFFADKYSLDRDVFEIN
jgi:hypothetical protein